MLYLQAEEASLQLSDLREICRHDRIGALIVFVDLVDYQLGVSFYYQAANTETCRGAQARKQSLILGHVVCGLEVKANDVPQRLARWGSENHSSPRALEGERAVEMHGPGRCRRAGVRIDLLGGSR